MCDIIYTLYLWLAKKLFSINIKKNIWRFVCMYVNRYICMRRYVHMYMYCMFIYNIIIVCVYPKVSSRVVYLIQYHPFNTVRLPFHILSRVFDSLLNCGIMLCKEQFLYFKVSSCFKYKMYKCLKSNIQEWDLRILGT